MINSVSFTGDLRFKVHENGKVEAYLNGNPLSSDLARFFNMSLDTVVPNGTFNVGQYDIVLNRKEK
jgi:hypothetical protein